MAMRVGGNQMHTLRVIFRSTVGKKAVMALTGVVLFGWLGLHLLGNLLVFSGAHAIDGYSAMLHRRPGLLWLMRGGLLLALTLHVLMAAQLTARARAARPARYRVQRLQVATFSARTMRWSGVLLVALIGFHLLHLTLGAIHPTFQAGAVYHNLLTGLRGPGTALLYIAFVSLVALHLRHGLESARRSLGVGRDAASPPHTRLAAGLALALWLGFVAVPLAVLLGGIG